MSKLRIVLFVMIVLCGSGHVSASGIPTVDVASLTQAVTDYLNQLEQYAEQMDQGITQEEELLNAIQQYEQMLTEYEHMLIQMQELEDKVSARDWEAIYESYEDIINSFPSIEPDYTDPEWQDANEQIGHVYKRGAELDDLEDEIQGMPYTAEAEEVVMGNARRAHNQAQLATGQAVAVEKLNKRLKDQMELSDDLDTARLSLGPESHLQTLQLMVEQNQAILDALHQEIAVSNTTLKYSNQLSSEYFSAQKEGQEANRKEIREKMSEPLTINEDPLVNF